jgi:hypothetical protein
MSSFTSTPAFASTHAPSAPTQQPSLKPRATSSDIGAYTQFLYYTLALVAIIASVCFFSICYRRNYYYFSKIPCCAQAEGHG